MRLPPDGFGRAPSVFREVLAGAVSADAFFAATFALGLRHTHARYLAREVLSIREGCGADE